jgi:hypothetical protein
MGNQDNWTTPKQIKIEREGEPRGTRRGKLKKGQRRKGRKARMDEVISAHKNWLTYKGWYERALTHDYRDCGILSSSYQRKRMEEARRKFEKIREEFVKDWGDIDESFR